MTKKKDPKDLLKAGRPTKYRPNFPAKLIKFFDQPLYIERLEEKMAASGAIKEITVREANDMPLFDCFCRSVGISMESFNQYTKEYPLFAEAYREAKGIQKRFISTHSLNNKYNANFAKFFAINNLGMREQSHLTTENEHTVKEYGLAFDLSKDPEQIAEENKTKQLTSE